MFRSSTYCTDVQLSCHNKRILLLLLLLLLFISVLSISACRCCKKPVVYADAVRHRTEGGRIGFHQHRVPFQILITFSSRSG